MKYKWKTFSMIWRLSSFSFCLRFFWCVGPKSLAIPLQKVFMEENCKKKLTKLEQKQTKLRSLVSRLLPKTKYNSYLVPQIKPMWMLNRVCISMLTNSGRLLIIVKLLALALTNLVDDLVNMGTKLAKQSLGQPRH